MSANDRFKADECLRVPAGPCVVSMPFGSKAGTAVYLLERRRVIEGFTDPEERAAALAHWRMELDAYWEKWS